METLVYTALFAPLVGSIFAALFGALTVFSGGMVLFGPDSARAAAGEYVPFVVWFNFIAGFFYILTAFAMWRGASWALPAAVALKQLEIVERDNLAARAEVLGARLKAGLERLCQSYEAIGDVRGKGLYSMIDVVADKKTKRPDAAMAERIRYNAMIEGVVLICVKNYIRLCPPLIITEAQLADVLGRLETAIKRAEEGFPTTTNISSSSSLATNNHHEFRGHQT